VLDRTRLTALSLAASFTDIEISFQHDVVATALITALIATTQDLLMSGTDGVQCPDGTV
jgi:hypothetical protein